MKQQKPFDPRIIIGMLSGLLLLISAGCTVVDLRYGLISLAVSAVAIALVILAQARYHNYYYRIISEIGGSLDAENHKALLHFPMPVIVCSKDRNILWYNDLFRSEVLRTEDLYGESFDAISEESLSVFCKPEGLQLSWQGGTYLVFGHCSQENAYPLYILYFTDVTRLSQLAEEYRLTRPTVLLMSIDNYSELLDDVKESAKSFILSELDMQMEKFIGETTGFLRKLARDRFIAVVEERHIAKMKADRFPILDGVRNISTGSGGNMTLSIGVGHGAKTLAESEQFARQALDMALGRGGDQAAVKTAQGYDFYGGVSKGVEKRTKVKTRVIASALEKVVEKADKVLVMGHRYSDLDSVGASVGMVHIIRAMGKNAYAVVDKSTSLAAPLIEKAQEECDDLFVNVSTACDMTEQNTLLIVVDAHNAALLESQELYRLSRQVVVIDHHRKTVNHIDNAIIFYHEPYASSACEMVAELSQYCEGVTFSANTAECLLAGIMLDTKNFVLRTGVRTFEAAAFLRGRGADTVRVKKLFGGSMESYQKKAALVSSAEIYRRCAISRSSDRSPDMRVVASQAADELLNIDRADASFVLYPTADGVNISGRSFGEINVQVVLETLGGGGHQTMAAAQLPDVDLAEARTKLLAAIDGYYGN